MKVRALGSQVTVYDDDMNIIMEIPDKPPEDPNAEVRMINIVDYEDMLMGIDPNERPDYFIDFETDERYKSEYTIEDFNSIKFFDPHVYLKCCIFFLITSISFIAGYLVSAYLINW